MERKKIQRIDLDRYELQILEMTVHDESYDTILNEFDGDVYILGDCLRNLVRQKVLRLLEWDEKSQHWLPRIIYDADKLKDYRYQLTSLGIRLMEDKE